MQLEKFDEVNLNNNQIETLFSSIACHNSIRAGRKLNIEEMNNLLRLMEKTPNSGQCNHGRPTFVELNIKDMEKLLVEINLYSRILLLCSHKFFVYNVLI